MQKLPTPLKGRNCEVAVIRLPPSTESGGLGKVEELIKLGTLKLPEETPSTVAKSG